jgi:hypothetical protein
VVDFSFQEGSLSELPTYLLIYQVMLLPTNELIKIGVEVHRILPNYDLCVRLWFLHSIEKVCLGFN